MLGFLVVLTDLFFAFPLDKTQFFRAETKMASIIGTAQHSEDKEITYQRTWKIRDFPRLMRVAKEEFCLDAEMIQILLPDGSTWSWQLTCYPNSEDRAEIRLELDRLSTFEGELNTAVAVRLLKKGKDKGKTLLKRRHTFSRRGEDGSWLELAAPHHVLKKSADSLMPEGILTIFVEIKILPSKQTTVHSRLRAFQPSSPRLKPDSKAQPSSPSLKPDSKEESMASMLMDSHVDLGPSLVQLVFKDSKLLCHTFPLAARLAVQVCNSQSLRVRIWLIRTCSLGSEVRGAGPVPVCYLLKSIYQYSNRR